ncbi:MAG: glycosyltransferase family 2 protein [Solirubrobacteraceae bacterium]
MTPPVTVVVPARNAAATIGRTLAALSAQLWAGEPEVIIVDSGSSDRTAELAAAAGVRVLHNPSGEPAGSRNLGVRHSNGEVLAFTDADCQPEPGWLAAGVRALERGFGIVQGRVVPAGAPGPFDRTVSVGGEYGLYETANLFVRRDVFERIGGFEPVPGVELGAADAPFGEDAWFVWRARRRGARTTFATEAVVRHAVFPRGFSGWWHERLRTRHFPALVAAIPELRATFLHRRLFLSPASSRFDLALLAVACSLSSRRHWPAAAALPYLNAALGQAATAPAGSRLKLAAGLPLADALTCVSLLAGSLSARTPVL